MRNKHEAKYAAGEQPQYLQKLKLDFSLKGAGNRIQAAERNEKIIKLDPRQKVK